MGKQVDPVHEAAPDPDLTRYCESPRLDYFLGKKAYRFMTEPKPQHEPGGHMATGLTGIRPQNCHWC